MKRVAPLVSSTWLAERLREGVSALCVSDAVKCCHVNILRWSESRWLFMTVIYPLYLGASSLRVFDASWYLTPPPDRTAKDDFIQKVRCDAYLWHFICGHMIDCLLFVLVVYVVHYYFFTTK